MRPPIFLAHNSLHQDGNAFGFLANYVDESGELLFQLATICEALIADEPGEDYQRVGEECV